MTLYFLKDGRPPQPHQAQFPAEPPGASASRGRPSFEEIPGPTDLLFHQLPKGRRGGAAKNRVLRHARRPKIFQGK